MTTVAIVTGASAGLGRALVSALSTRLPRSATVYLTGRHPTRLRDAYESLPSGDARVRTALLDVADQASIDNFVCRVEADHGGVDIVYSNAYHRIVPTDDPVQAITPYVATNNLGTTRLLRALGPRLRPGGRYIVVASTLGTLHYLAPVLHSRFDDADSLDEVDRQVIAWRDSVLDGRAPAEAWPSMLNIPSKIGQVAAVRAWASQHREADLASGTLVAAACPGLIATGSSRPWFDMRRAQAPEIAADRLIDATLGPVDLDMNYGELNRFGTVLPWKPNYA